MASFILIPHNQTSDQESMQNFPVIISQLLHFLLFFHLFLRSFLLQDPPASSTLTAPPPPLPAALPRRIHKPHALCRQHASGEARGQLPWRQWRAVGVRAQRRRVGGLWGHVLGPRLQDSALPRRLHQSLRLQLLDQESHQTGQRGRREGSSDRRVSAWWTLSINQAIKDTVSKWSAKNKSAFSPDYH